MAVVTSRARRSRGRVRHRIGIRRSWGLTLGTGVLLLYSLLPLVWLLVNATKTQEGLRASFGLWFASDFALFDNIARVLTYDDGVFLRWLLNTLLYVVAGAGGATLISTIGGYGLAKFDFAGKKFVFAVIIGAVAVPGTALAVPTFLLFSSAQLTNNPLAVIIPSLVAPFGLYLMWVYSTDAIPNDLLDAARVDGASELRTFRTIGLPLLGPGVVTVLLFTTVSNWNNYFLPLIMIRNPDWYPLTVGINSWNMQASTAGGEAIFDLVITGSLLMIIPIIAIFLVLQRYWQSGLAAGGVKQ
ncbi:carbohydrate ABC transporter permease [Brachybacterium sp. ACRRE]|uniref:carbohydrate ABC transporter permease n=1 Tax=Brachybacterium sp. ACRRE TaxID=2918184 RepID=UPI001EF2599D|nr:carbohydrate ABC transporter permease [Brachybacterium sp. ACRRE]MCG7311067.1 carbohydrate ABC transporter permease [Brachybacterium sp. ACRRE]